MYHPVNMEVSCYILYIFKEISWVELFATLLQMVHDCPPHEHLRLLKDVNYLPHIVIRVLGEGGE